VLRRGQSQVTKLADRLDLINRAVGALTMWLALAMVLLQFAIVLLRYVFGVSYIFLGEGVLYLHAALFMLATRCGRAGMCASTSSMPGSARAAARQSTFSAIWRCWRRR
jgi:hypothetical protein